MTRLRDLGRFGLMFALTSILASGLTSPVAAQESDQLFAGDSVRVNMRIVGLSTGERIQLQQQLEEQEDLIAELRRKCRTRNGNSKG